MKIKIKSNSNDDNNKKIFKIFKKISAKKY